MNFIEWLYARSYDEIWKSHNNIVIGLGSALIEVFNAIIGHLKDLHQKNRFHGNLYNNVRIHQATVGGSTWKVNITPPLPSLIDLVRGIVTDVEDLRRLVEFVNEVHPLPAPRPSFWTLFFDSHYCPSHRLPSHRQIRFVKKIAFFNYSHPIFFNPVTMVHFIYKLAEIRKRNQFDFTTYISLDASTPLADVGNWCLDRLPWNRNFPNDDIRQSPLIQVLYDRRNGPPKFRMHFYNSYELPFYLRTVCEHARDINTRVWSGKIINELHQTLPDALPKIHFLLRLELFHDGFCHCKFGADIIKLMRHGPFGYKGFKFN